MEILHVSAECYPMAKAGGLADVVGALPKYQQELGHIAKVVMPMHRTKFLYDNEWEVSHKGSFNMGKNYYEFTIIKEKSNKLGFDLYCVDINGLLDREKIYGYNDDAERFTAFQIAVLEWVSRWKHIPDVINVHDHHTALIPFMLQHCYAYRHISSIPTLLTIHNAQYQGWMGWDKATYLPAWDTWRWGLLDWSNVVNPLASGIKCANKVNTVSPGYMQEMMYHANGLESLIRAESFKCTGIINGIDYEVWNPDTDTYIIDNYSYLDVEEGKHLNKKKLCDDFGFDIKLPLFVFIGRLVQEKAADLLPEAISRAFMESEDKFSFLILGSGEPWVENALSNLQHTWFGYYNSQIGYNEKLSHQMYAGADFLLMPSRVEPCGLNQLYALRYGTVPVVRRIGGLRDTVIDFGDEGGYGICFNHASVDDIVYSIKRGIELYKNKKQLKAMRTFMMQLQNSWEFSAKKYIELYQSL
ncbi:MAG: glycogen/starch synthase [Bacteroidetes bacterium]|nr:glycogen/starch synthase [Bacteroidota bacterium]